MARYWRPVKWSGRLPVYLLSLLPPPSHANLHILAYWAKMVMLWRTSNDHTMATNSASPTRNSNEITEQKKLTKVDSIGNFCGWLDEVPFVTFTCTAVTCQSAQLNMRAVLAFRSQWNDLKYGTNGQSVRSERNSYKNQVKLFANHTASLRNQKSVREESVICITPTCVNLCISLNKTVIKRVAEICIQIRFHQQHEESLADVLEI